MSTLALPAISSNISNLQLEVDNVCTNFSAAVTKPGPRQEKPVTFQLPAQSYADPDFTSHANQGHAHAITGAFTSCWRVCAHGFMRVDRYERANISGIDPFLGMRLDLMEASMRPDSLLSKAFTQKSSIVNGNSKKEVNRINQYLCALLHDCTL